MTTLFDLKKGANLPDEPIYVSEPNEETQNFAHVTVYDPEDFILWATKNRRDGKLHYEALVTQRNMLIHALHNLVIRCEMEDEQGRLVVKDDLLKIANKLIGRAAQ